MIIIIFCMLYAAAYIARAGIKQARSRFREIAKAPPGNHAPAIADRGTVEREITIRAKIKELHNQLYYYEKQRARAINDAEKMKYCKEISRVYDEIEKSQSKLEKIGSE